MTNEEQSKGLLHPYLSEITNYDQIITNSLAKVTSPNAVSYTEPMALFSTPLDILVPVLSDMQSEIEDIETTMVNSFLKSTYADLSAYLRHIRPYLKKYQLAFHQTTDFHLDEKIFVTTVIHVSGQWVKSFLPFSYILERVTIDKKTGEEKQLNPIKTMQNIGAALGLARRYGLGMALGLAQQDTDGETNKNIKPKSQKTKSNNELLIYSERFSDLCKANQCDPSAFVSFFKIDTSKVETLKEAISSFAAKKENLDLYNKLKTLCTEHKIDLKAFANTFNITRYSIIEIKDCIENFEAKKLELAAKLLGA